MAGAMLKGTVDMARGDKPGKNARDGFITEHTEITAYELLARLAMRAGDHETARVAREIRHEEEEMAEWIASHWDRFFDLMLEEAGLEPAGARS
jgi:ferritin-like metal-binding protein YciE